MNRSLHRHRGRTIFHTTTAATTMAISISTSRTSFCGRVGYGRLAGSHTVATADASGPSAGGIGERRAPGGIRPGELGRDGWSAGTIS
jgi:hypothetical protein